MSGMHPQFMLSKRFPVHTAIEMQDLTTLASLLSKAMDARFHFERKLTNNEVSALHQACCARTQPSKDWVDIVTVCLHLGAPVNEPDCIGQTPLFYAITHCQANELVPLLLKSGAYVNQPRWSDGWTVLHVAAMVGTREVTSMLLQAGANTALLDEQGRTAAKLASRYGFKSLAETINKSPKSLFKDEKIISKPSQNEPPQVILKIDTQTNVLHTNGVTTHKHNDLDDMSEEVAWALQMKREQEEAKQKAESRKTNLEDNNVMLSNKQPNERKKTQEERMREIKAKYEEERKERENPQQSQAEQLVNIAEVMERKRQRRMDARRKMTDKDKIEKEQAALREAMYDEIIWALELKKDLAEQSGETDEVEKYVKLIKEEEEKKDGTWERRIKQAEKDKEEKKRQAELAVEREKQMAIEKEAELKRAKENAAKMLIQQKKMEEEMQRRKEQEAFDKLPKWKKDKILRAKRDAEEKILKEQQEAEEKILKEKHDAEEKILQEKQKEEEKIMKANQAEEEKILKTKMLEEEKENIRKKIEMKAKQEEEEKEREMQLQEVQEKEEQLYREQEAERIVFENKRVIELKNAQKKAEEESIKIEKEKKQAEENRKKEAERKIQEELRKQEDNERRLAEEQRQQEKIKTAEEEILRAKEERRLQEEKIKAQERELKQKEEEMQLLHRVEERIRKREAEDSLRREEAKRLHEEKKKEEEEARKIKEQIWHEQKSREEEEFNKKQLEKKLCDEKQKAEEQALMIEEKKRLEEGKRKADEEMKIQLERVEARRKRRAEDEALRIEELKKMREERTKAEEDTREAEQERIKRHNEMVAEKEERAKQRELEEYMRKEEEQTLKRKLEEELAMRKVKEENERKQEELKKTKQEEEELKRKEKEEKMKINLKENQMEMKIDNIEIKLHENERNEDSHEQSKTEGEEEWEDYDWEWEDEEPINIKSTNQELCKIVNHLEQSEPLQFQTLVEDIPSSLEIGEHPFTTQQTQVDECELLQNSENDIVESKENVVNGLKDEEDMKLRIETSEAIDLDDQNNYTVSDDNDMDEDVNSYVINDFVSNDEMVIKLQNYDDMNGDSENEYAWEWKDAVQDSKEDIVLDQYQAAVELINYLEDENRSQMSSEILPEPNFNLYKEIETAKLENEIDIIEDYVKIPKECRIQLNEDEHGLQEKGIDEETVSDLELQREFRFINSELEEEQMKKKSILSDCDVKIFSGDDTEMRIQEEPERTSIRIHTSNNNEELKDEANEYVNNKKKEIVKVKKGDNFADKDNENHAIVAINQLKEEHISIFEEKLFGIQADHMSYTNNEVKKEDFKSVREEVMQQKNDISFISDKEDKTSMVLSDENRENHAMAEKNRLQDLIRIVQEKIENAKKEKEKQTHGEENQEESSLIEADHTKFNNPLPYFNLGKEEVSSYGTKINKSDTDFREDFNEKKNSIDPLIVSQTKMDEFELRLEQNDESDVQALSTDNNDSILSDQKIFSGTDHTKEAIGPDVSDGSSLPLYSMSEVIETNEEKCKYSSINRSTSEKYHLKEASDFGDPSNSDYFNEPDFESKDHNEMIELPNVPPRKRENKQNFNHKTSVGSIEKDLDSQPANSVLAKEQSSEETTLLNNNDSTCTPGNEPSYIFTNDKTPGLTTACSHDVLSDLTTSLVFEQPNVPVRKKDTKQKDDDVQISESVSNHCEIKPVINVFEDKEELNEHTEIEKKNDEGEEKNRLERLISMVQEKINAARKQKEQ